MNIFLKNIHREQLYLLQLIASEETPETVVLMEKAALSRSKLKRLIQELNDDLDIAFDGEVTIKQNNQFRYYFDSVYPENYIFHKMKLYYLEQSLHFQLIFFIAVEEQQWTNDDLCEHFAVSLPYLYQLIRESNELIQDFGIQLKRKNDTEIILDGPEYRIRLFLFIAVLFSYHGFESPINCKNPEVKKRIWELPRTSSEKELIYFVYAIGELRMSQGHFVQRMPVQVSEILALFEVPENIKQLNDLFIHPYSDDPEIYTKEIFIIRMFIRMFVYSLESKEHKIEIGKQATLLDNPLSLFCEQLLGKLLVDYEVQLDNDLFYELMYYSLLSIVFLEYFKVNLDTVLSLTTTVKEIKDNDHFSPVHLKPVEEFYQRFIAHFPMDLEFLEDEKMFIEFISTRLYLFLNVSKTETFKIYIHYSRNLLGEMMLEKKLHQIYTNETLQVTRNPEEADLIITDCVERPEEQAEGATYFFFYDLENKYLWEKLFLFIQKQISQRVFHAIDPHSSKNK